MPTRRSHAGVDGGGETGAGEGADGAGEGADGGGMVYGSRGGEGGEGGGEQCQYVPSRGEHVAVESSYPQNLNLRVLVVCVLNALLQSSALPLK